MNQDMNNIMQAQLEFVNAKVTQKWLSGKVRDVAHDCDCDRDMAEDAVQSALMRLLEKIHEGTIIDDIDSYVFVSAKRQIHEDRRSAYNRGFADVDALTNSTHNLGDPGQMFWLGEEHAEILREIINADQSLQDVADAFGLGNHNNVNRIVTRWLED